MTESPSTFSHPPQPSGLAIASMILGILGLLCLGPLVGIPAIICGHMALSRINRSSGAIGGKGQAIAGLIMGYLGLVLTIISIALFALFAVSSAEESSSVQELIEAIEQEHHQLPNEPTGN